MSSALQLPDRPAHAAQVDARPQPRLRCVSPSLSTTTTCLTQAPHGKLQLCVECHDPTWQALVLRKCAHSPSIDSSAGPGKICTRDCRRLRPERAQDPGGEPRSVARCGRHMRTRGRARPGRPCETHCTLANAAARCSPVQHPRTHPAHKGGCTQRPRHGRTQSHLSTLSCRQSLSSPRTQAAWRRPPLAGR